MLNIRASVMLSRLPVILSEAKNLCSSLGVNSAKRPFSLSWDTGRKDRDPSPAGKHGGLRMTSGAKCRTGVQWARRVAALTGLLFFSARAYAQGCAMRYTSAAAAKADAIQALRSGILILLVPPLVMFAGIFVVIYRSRNRFYGTADWTAEQDREWREMLIRMDSVEQTEFRGRMLPLQVEESRVESRK